MKAVSVSKWMCTECADVYQDRHQAELCCMERTIDSLEVGSRIRHRRYPEMGTVVLVSTLRGTPVYILKPDCECAETDSWNLACFTFEQIQLGWEKIW